jgi:uncharacterized protein YceH (UPF0502 family)
VFGCLLEKRWTTPDQYPLSLNALRLACNQSTNRDPVTHYDESTVRDAAQRLCKYGLARLASGHSSRAIKYRHLAEEALGLGREELAVLAVLLLRGPQTPGELKGRSERMATIDSLEQVDLVLDALIAHGYAARLERRPGQKEERFMHLLGDGSIELVEPEPAVIISETGPSLAQRVAALEQQMAERVAALEQQMAERVAALEQQMAELREQLGLVESVGGPVGEPD